MINRKFIDHMGDKLGIQRRDLIEKEIIEKINTMLKFEKYSQNLKNKETQFKEDLILGEEEVLLLTPIDKGFPKFLKEFNLFLIEIIKELKI